MLLFSCTTSNFHCGFSQPQASAKDIGSNFFARVPFPEKHVNLRTATWPRNSCSCASYFCATVLGVKKSPVKPRDVRETLKRVEMVGNFTYWAFKPQFIVKSPTVQNLVLRIHLTSAGSHLPKAFLIFLRAPFYSYASKALCWWLCWALNDAENSFIKLLATVT